MSICICMHIYVYMCVYAYMHVYVPIYLGMSGFINWNCSVRFTHLPRKAELCRAKAKAGHTFHVGACACARL